MTRFLSLLLLMTLSCQFIVAERSLLSKLFQKTTSRFHIMQAVGSTFPSASPLLTSLSTSIGSITAFDSNQLTYTQSTSDSAVTVTATTDSGNQLSLQVENRSNSQQTLQSGVASTAIVLNVNTVTVVLITVSSSDDSQSNTYTLNIVQQQELFSSNANLRNFTSSAGDAAILTPLFSSRNFSYILTVPFSQTTLSFTPIAADQLATITIAETAGAQVTAPQTVQTNTTSQLFDTSAVTTLFAIVVTAQDGVTTQTYTVNVTRSSVNGKRSVPAIIGDPQFTGLRGQRYQIHGVDKEIYCLISDEFMQLNAQFVFLNEGRCPVIDGSVMKDGCYGHPGSYLGKLGLRTKNGHILFILPGAYDQGFARVSLDEKSVSIGQRVSLGDAGEYVDYQTSHQLEFQYGYYRIVVTSSDRFVNQQITVIKKGVNSHGLIGQTWRLPSQLDQKNTNARIKHIEGEVDDYSESDLFSADSVFAQFNTQGL